MDVIVLTGGIATGKSTVAAYLKEIGGDSLGFYDCDRAVSRLLSTGQLAGQLIDLFGENAVDSASGSANKDFIREHVFHDYEQKKKLEGLLHPILQQECLAEIESARQNQAVRAFIADVPLYYESEFSCGEKAVCVVGVSAKTQRERLASRNHYATDLLQAMISSQLSISDKMNRADYVLWNEGPREMLYRQVKQFYHIIT